MSPTRNCYRRPLLQNHEQQQTRCMPLEVALLSKMLACVLRMLHKLLLGYTQTHRVRLEIQVEFQARPSCCTVQSEKADGLTFECLQRGW